MADQFYFSRNTRLIIEDTAASNRWEIPILDGYSFSQATNSSEITLNEAADASGNSRRGRQMFNDSLAPAEWSFSTYMRPFKSAGSGAGAASAISGDTHAVEEVLWAMMAGDATYSTSTILGDVNAINNPTAPSDVAANRIGTSNLTTAGLATSTDGGGSGAKVKITYTASSGAFTMTLDATATGSGYTDDDFLFISKEAAFAALNAAFVAGGGGTNALVIGDLDADFQVQVNGVGTTNNRNGFTGFTRDGTDLDIGFGSSNKVTLGTMTFYFILNDSGDAGADQVYKITECAVNEASIDFDIDGIATINWSGMGKLLSDNTTTVPAATVTEGTLASDTSNFIRNRLTSLVASSSLSGGSVTYDLVLTGGNITISNNLTYLTPETLGVVNSPLGHVTGTRSVSGNFTCYLNTVTSGSSTLFKHLIEGTSTVTNDFDLTFKVGGASTTPRVELNMAQCHLEVPTHSIEDVISVDASFNALPSSVDGTDEVTIKYVGA